MRDEEARPEPPLPAVPSALPIPRPQRLTIPTPRDRAMLVDPMDGKRLSPPDVDFGVESAYSAADAVVLASSNYLRNTLGIGEAAARAGPPPRCATRKNPSLDNYLAEFLLRASHAPAHHVAPFEECAVRGSSQQLSTELNPSLAGAVLIGIGGASRNPEVRQVYDEHREGGLRNTRSTTQIVFEEHLQPLGDGAGMRMLKPVVEEVSAIDAAGGATYDHLYSIAKILHVARFPQPGLIPGRLDACWKRAVLDAALASAATVSFDGYDNEQTLASLLREVDEFVERSVDLELGGAADWDDGIVRRVAERLRKPNQAQVHGAASVLTLRKVYHGMRKMWRPSVTSWVMGVFFEALFQAQRGFEDMQQRPLRFERLAGGYHLLWYERRPGDILPHRGLSARMSREGKRGVLVVHDPLWRSTMMMRTQQLAYEVWSRFVGLVRAADDADCWYTPTQADGTIASFLLNRSESFIGAPATRLGPDDVSRLLDRAIRN